MNLSYPKEMHIFLLEHTGLIEQGSLTDAVEHVVYSAIFERITSRLERRLWDSHFDASDVGETMLCPIHWPRCKDETRLAYYRIGETGEGNVRWLSSLLGLNGVQTCLELYVDGRTGGPKVNVRERILAFYTKTSALQELGFTCTDGELRLPFSFDAVKLAEEYPDLRKRLLEFERVFDKFLKGNDLIEKLIMSMTPEKANHQPDAGAQEPAAKK